MTVIRSDRDASAGETVVDAVRLHKVPAEGPSGYPWDDGPSRNPADWWKRGGGPDRSEVSDWWEPINDLWVRNFDRLKPAYDEGRDVGFDFVVMVPDPDDHPWPFYDGGAALVAPWDLVVLLVEFPAGRRWEEGQCWSEESDPDFPMYSYDFVYPGHVLHRGRIRRAGEEWTGLDEFTIAVEDLDEDWGDEDLHVDDSP
jgi:hypothetical protein